MTYYDKHVFFCTNQRAPGAPKVGNPLGAEAPAELTQGCCNNFGSSKMRDYVKDKVKALGLSSDAHPIRINAAGCLGRCDEGPVLVVYPEGVWYTYVDESDIDEIIEEHLKNGRVVERLKI
jgi:(2Fe-2S) ferredoxin